MKKILFIAILLLSVANVQAQSRTNQISRPCPGTSTPALVSVTSATGNTIRVKPCSKGSVYIDSGAGATGQANGGDIALNSGDGAVIASSTSGDGGLLDIYSGDGGASTVAAANTSGIGGNVSIGAGSGGARTGASGTAGNGGNVNINAGLGGTGSGGASNGTPGEIRIGQTNRSRVEIGRDLSVTVIGDVLAAGNGTLLTVDDASGEITTNGQFTAASGIVATAGGIRSASPTAGIGYMAGSGGAQTQATNKATTVVSNTISTAVTMNNASLAADTTVSFTFTNSTIAATDTVICTHQSGGTSGSYVCNAFPGAGSAVVSVRNVTAGPLSEAIVLRITVIKSTSN